jgi:midasin (ATPase involved in ribosome maturation)
LGLPLRGRENELAAIRRRLVHVRGGTEGVIVLEGSAGVGKTRLIDECARIADELTFRVAADLEQRAYVAVVGIQLPRRSQGADLSSARNSTGE